MKSYLVVTGAVFAVVVVVHLAKLMVEGTHVLGDPFFVISTGIAAALSAWAVVLIQRLRSRASGSGG